jgi:hypothetical protein
MAWEHRSAGVEEQGKGTPGFARNLGGPNFSDRIVAWGCHTAKLQVRSPASGGQGAKTGATVGTAKRRRTKRGGMGVRTSEFFIVPWKPGNSGHEDPVEGRESRVIDRRRATPPELCVRIRCPRNDDGPRSWPFRAQRNGVPMT